MITDKLIKKVEKLAYGNSEEYEAPSLFHVQYSSEVALHLAERLGADEKVVLVGSLLMDCMLGTAIKEGRAEDHTRMSEQVAMELLSEFKELTDEEKINIVYCVKEHHGVKKFYSLESEICCNADCYKFLSIKGVIGGIHNGRKMDLEELIKLYSQKAEEKWKVLTLSNCKKELAPQYRLIKKLFASYK